MALMQVHWYDSSPKLSSCSQALQTAGYETNVPDSQYTAAAKTSSLEPTARALTTLSEVFKRDPKLPSILGAPTLTPSDKSQIVQELQKHMGNIEKGDTVKNFMKTLADNNRLGILEGVCEKFAVLMGAAKGELEMVVQSASVSHWAEDRRGKSRGIRKVGQLGNTLADVSWDAETRQQDAAEAGDRRSQVRI